MRADDAGDRKLSLRNVVSSSCLPARRRTIAQRSGVPAAECSFATSHRAAGHSPAAFSAGCADRSRSRAVSPWAILPRCRHTPPPQDPREQQADQVADQVLRGPRHKAAVLPHAHHGDAPVSNHQLLRSSGTPLEGSARALFEPRFEQDFGSVRVHTDGHAAGVTNAVSARAFATGHTCSLPLASSSPPPQKGSGCWPTSWLTLCNSVRVSCLYSSVSPKPTRPPANRIEPALDDDPLKTWKHPSSALILLLAGDKLFIAPAERYVLTPSTDPAQDAAKAPAHFATDLGNLLSVPASGASGTRIFKAGQRSALLIDAGSDPSMGVRVEPVLPTPTVGQAAIYTAEFASLMGSLGLTKVSKVFVIHGHLDHVGAFRRLPNRGGYAPRT